jgi:endonuclease/exonuclease/phosphatase family metal-dependent hydrolase
MSIKVGTFNLNNLFSRFNFQGAITKIKKGDGAMTVRYEFSDEAEYRIRTYMGKLVKAKNQNDTKKIAQRLLDIDIDVLAVQEVENVDILKEFNRDHLGGLYRHLVLVEGNDPRLIDVAVLSKLPIGAVTSFQTATHPSEQNKRVFGRDLLEVGIWNKSRTMRLFTLYNNHLKSHYGDADDGGQGKVANDARRTKQAEVVAQIVSRRRRPDARFIITGDMNDPPDAAPLSPMLSIAGQPLVNGLANPVEIGEMKAEKPGEEPGSTGWTHRFKPTGQPPEHRLYDHVWLSQTLAPALEGGFIARRHNLTGDGSDHDPAWVELDL